MGASLHITKSGNNNSIVTMGCVHFRPGELYERYSDFISSRNADRQIVFSKVFSSRKRALLARYMSELIELLFWHELCLEDLNWVYTKTCGRASSTDSWRN
jgi:hypothetical protein